MPLAGSSPSRDAVRASATRDAPCCAGIERATTFEKGIELALRGFYTEHLTRLGLHSSVPLYLSVSPE